MNKSDKKEKKITITEEELSDKLATLIMAMNKTRPLTQLINDEFIEFSGVLLMCLFDNEEEENEDE